MLLDEIATRRDAAPDSFSDWMQCPPCRRALDQGASELVCSHCSRRYPIVLGIPDFRSVSAHAGAWPEESRLLPVMVEQYATSTLPVLLDLMLAGLNGKTRQQLEQLRRYFVADLPERAQARADVIELLCRKFDVRPDFSSALEIGCGAGATLFEVARRGHAVGLDPNLLHLIIAKKHAETLGHPVRLVCGFAECLPFPTGYFTLVNFMDTLEHFTDQPAGMREVHRVMAPNAVACFDVPNRLSLWREPHTNQWGLGFLPRQWTALRTIRNRSYWGLRRLVRGTFANHFATYPMLIRFESSRYAASAGVRVVAKILTLLQRAPLISQLIFIFQPGFEVIGQKRSAPESSLRPN